MAVSATMTAAGFGERIDGAAGGNGEWTGRCPAHDDQDASLSWRDGDKGLVIKCFAGCETKDVLAAVRLTFPDLFHDRRNAQRRNGHRARLTVEALAADKGLPVEFLKSNGVEQANDGVMITYRLMNGTPAPRQRRRTALVAREGSSWAGPKGVPLEPYGSWRLEEARKAGYCIAVEGETDCLSGWYHDFPVLGIPGADMVKVLRREHLNGIEKLYVVREPDSGGRNFIRNMKVRLKKLGWVGTVLVVTMPDSLKDLNDLHRADPGQFGERLRQAMDTGKSFDAIEADLVGQEPTTDGAATESTADRPDSGRPGATGVKPSQAQALVALTDSEEIFRATDGETAYATIAANGHHETWPVRSKGFRRWLTRKFYELEQKPPGAQALKDALGAVEARAQFAGSAHDVYVRLAAKEGAIFLDLANPEWEVVEITGEGWRIVPEAPVKFRRAKGMLSLPRPLRAGSLDELRRFVNVRGGEQWALLVAWLVAAARPVGPYPVLVLGGEHGTAKSTTAEVLRRLVDPSSAMLRAEPRDVRDVMIAANNGWMVALDNLSSIPPWLSDCLCRLATGGGFSTRELFSDQDETIFEAQRPVILNGIEEIVTRPDLLDRAILLDLPLIGEKDRKGAAEFRDAFEAARPRLLGALLDAVSAALRNVGGVRLPRLPRMADFAIWIEAAAPALGWREHHFLDVYSGNRAEANKLALDASPVGAALLAFADRRVEWTGPANKLLDEINRIADEPTRKAKSWPTTPRSLSSALRRIAPNLRALGVEVRFDRESSRERRRLVTITSTRVLDRPHRPDRPNTANIEDFASDARPEHVDGASPRPSDRKFAPDNGLDDVDGLDATFAGFSQGARTDRTGQPIVLRPARKRTTKMLGGKCSRHPVTARPECRDCQVSRAIDPDDPRNDLEPELDGAGPCVDGAGPGPSDPKSPADVAGSASDVEVRI